MPTLVALEALVKKLTAEVDLKTKAEAKGPAASAAALAKVHASERLLHPLGGRVTAAKSAVQAAERGKKKDEIKKAKEDLKKLEAEEDALGETYQAQKVAYANIVEANSKIREALARLKEQLSEAEEGLERAQAGVAAFGASRHAFLAWFAGEEAKLDAFARSVEAAAKAAEAWAKDTEGAVSKGDVAGAARSAAGARAKAEEAAQSFAKLDALVSGWGSTMDKQRNLKPKDHGIESDDVKVHAALTSQVYAKFKVGDHARLEARAAVAEAEDAADEARTYAEAGNLDEATFAKLLAAAEANIVKMEKSLDDTLNAKWSHEVMKDGAIFDKLSKAGREAALKGVEQGSTFIPASLVTVKGLVAQIGKAVGKAVQIVPPAFARTFKGDIDRLRIYALKASATLADFERHFAVTMRKMSDLEAELEAAPKPGSPSAAAAGPSMKPKAQ